MSAMSAETLDLVMRAKAGDQTAVTQLYQLYHHRVMGFLKARMSYDDRAGAEDLAQETFLRMLKGLKTFDPHRGVQLQSWLFTIAARLHIDQWRKRQRLLEVAAGASGDLAEWLPAVRSPERVVMSQMECAQLLASLPARAAAMTVLTQAYGFTIAEVAVRLGAAEGTVKSRTHSSLRRMAEVDAADEHMFAKRKEIQDGLNAAAARARRAVRVA